MKIKTEFKSLTTGLIAAAAACLCFATLAFAQAGTTGVVNQGANLRAGPSTSYAVVGGAPQGQSVEIASTNADGSWLQLSSGQWIAAFLVDVADDSAAAPATTATPAPATSSATALRDANLRAGPGTGYAIVGGVRAGQALAVASRNAAGTWLQLSSGNWIAAFLVSEETAASTNPAAPATATALPSATPAPEAAPEATPEPAPPASPDETADADEAAGSDFVVIQKRLLGPAENGGSTDGPSVHCGNSRSLRVIVVDENDIRLNGIPVQVQYGAKEVFVTGDQGKGDGVAEFILGGGQDVKVLRNADGSPADSEIATGLSTDPRVIPFDTLISSGYCQDEASCQTFTQNVSCIGHYSWEVVFQRR